MGRKEKKDTYIGRHRSLLVGSLCLLGVCIIAQNDPVRPVNAIPMEADSQQVKKTRVDLLHADVGWADQEIFPDAQVLIGSVQFLHDSMYMYCDSAIVYEKTNSFEAWDNVRMEQGDTLFIYGDYLYYDGVTRLARLRENVRMENGNTTLLTDSLNYDRVYDLGYYFMGGTLIDEENVLTSDWGEYSPSTKESVFNHDVKLVNPQFVLTSDTLHYNTDSKIATILGPSDIVSDENHIYSERGIYNTLTEQAELMDRSVLTTHDGKTLTGDSLFYDKVIGYGEAFDNVVMNDTVNKNMLLGNYCYYNEITEYAWATSRAVAVDYSQGDSLFLHGDTLKMTSYHLNTDSVYRITQAYHKVRMYRTDFQGVCDSLVYITKDSCITMYHDPVLWNEAQQLLGEEIKIYMNDSTIDWAHIINQALTVEMMDPVHYNQVTGKEMKAYFIEGEMKKVDVISNVRVVYYPVDEKDNTLIGLNESETSLLNMYLEERKLERMVMSPKSNGVLYPMDQIPPDKYRLANFVWLDYMRPLNKDDIFEWRGKREGETLKKSTRTPVATPNREQFRLR
ncbi:MAG: hypothetical protein LUE93_05285 [Bacteroides sp.]|nr:hypothetical protein [Bacteroides sp.]